MILPTSAFWPMIIVHLSFVSMPCGMLIGLFLGLALSRRWSSRRRLLFVDAVAGAIGFVFGEVAVSLGPTTVRSHDMGHGTIMTNYNEALFAPFRYPLAVAVAAALVVSVHYAITRWQKSRILLSQP